MTHHSEPAREAAALDTESIAIGLFANTVAYGVDPRKVWAESATEKCKSAFRKTASDLASPAPAAGGLEAVREAFKRWKDGYGFNEDSDADVELSERADTEIAALASPAATSAETQGGDGVREAAEDLCIAVERDIPSWQSFSVRTHLNRLREALSSPSTSAATRGEPVAVTPEMAEAGRKAIADERARVGMQYPDTLAVLAYRAMSAVASPPAPAVESAQVKVKPLVWLDNGRGLYSADEGRYVVDATRAGEDSKVLLLLSFARTERFDRVADAMAAAQAKHESRIRASLDLATDAEG